jgi:hypothetical protein
MARRTILLSDSQTVRPEAAQYAIEFAKRTNPDLVFLVLLSADEGDVSEIRGKSAEQLAGLERTLASQVERARAAGVSAEAVVKTGDPCSELVKFLAASGPFQTIVWGGRQEVPQAGARGPRPHWLAKIKDIVECPVVVPSRKA